MKTPELTDAKAAPQHLVEYDVQRQVLLAFHVSPLEAQKLLPDPWRTAVVPAGASKGANFMFLFRNRLLTLDYDSQGNESVGGQDRGVVIFIYTRNPNTEEEGLRVVRSYSADLGVIPGPYGNTRLASVETEQTAVTRSASGGIGIESWTINDIEEGKGFLKLFLGYQLGMPVRSKAHLKMYGGSDPAFFRYYRAERGGDVVRSVPAQIDRTEEFQWEAKLEELSSMFDGTESLISITVEPWYFREVWMPDVPVQPLENGKSEFAS
jgi:hypothetical protein